MGRSCSIHENEMHTKVWTMSDINRPLGRPVCRSKDTIKIDLKQIIWLVVDWFFWLMIWTSDGYV
jgi:hypothetical protein